MKLPKLLFSIKGLDQRSLALSRILLGIVLIADLLFYKFPYFNLFFAGNAIIDSSMIKEMSSSYKFSLHYFLGSGTTASVIIFCLAFLTYILFAVGYKTRIMAILAYLLLYSIQERNIYFLIGGSDDILRLGLFWSIFLPLNNTFSLSKTKEISGIKKNIEIRSLAIYAFIAQIGFIYFFNALSKNGITWQNGTAVSYSLMIVYMKSFASDWLLLKPALCTFLTYFVKYTSFIIIFLLFSPVKNNLCRIIAVILIFIFHWGMLPFLNIGHFCLSTLPVIGILLPAIVWNKVFKNSENPNAKDITQIEYPKQKPALNSFIALSLLFIVLINLNNLSKKKNAFTYFLIHNIGNCYGLNQGWAMFAPDPPKESGIIYTVGVTNEDSFINLETNTKYEHEQIVKEITKKNNLLPLPLVTLHLFSQSIPANTNKGQKFWENWVRTKLGSYSKNKFPQKIKRVLIVYVFANSISSSKYSSPSARPIFKKDL
jgi:hypothetical protein